MEIILANPRGFCAGVDRAILLVERALILFGKPVYVRHEIVHNKYVVAELEKRGVIFAEDIREIPPKSTVIFSAHGSSKKIRREAEERSLRIFDAICPLVTKVHMEVQRFELEGYECILIGHAGHPEVEGTLGQFGQLRQSGEKRTSEQAPKQTEALTEASPAKGIYLVGDCCQAETVQVRNPAKLAYVTQTTLSVDDTKEIIGVLKRRFPQIKEPAKDDICYATQNRQDAVKSLAAKCDLILVIGSENSSNSNRLCEIAKSYGSVSYLINDVSHIKKKWLDDVRVVGITAGASAPEKLVQNTLDFFRANYPRCVIRNAPGKPENVIFNLPAEIRALPIKNIPVWESLSEFGANGAK